MGKHKKKHKDKNGNPKPSKRAKTEPAKPKPAKSAKPKTAPSAQPAPVPAPVPARAAQQGGGDVEPDPEPQPYQLGDPLPPRIVYKHKPKYWVHNLPDGYGKCAGLISRSARLIRVSTGFIAQGRGTGRCSSRGSSVLPPAKYIAAQG